MLTLLAFLGGMRSATKGVSKPQQGKFVKDAAATKSGTASYNTEGDVVEEAVVKKKKKAVEASTKVANSTRLPPAPVGSTWTDLQSSFGSIRHAWGFGVTVAGGIWNKLSI